MMEPPNTTQANDARLARFDMAFRANYEAACRFALRCGASEPDDVASECFAALWRRLESVAEGSERAWLFAAVRKHTANERRSIARRGALIDELAANHPSRTAWSPSIATTDSLVALALQTLSHSDQEALILHIWDGFGPDQIAQVLGLSKGATAVRLHRAKRRFRQEYLRRKAAAFTQTTPVAGGCDAQ